MAPQQTTTLEGDVNSSINPAISTPHRNTPKTQDASTDIPFPRRDSGYESPSPPSPPHHQKSRPSNPSAPPPQPPPTMSPSRSSSRPTTSHRSPPSSRSSRASNPTSRRSSFLLQPLPQAPRPRPQLATRAASENHLHLRHNPFLPSRSTFPPTPTTSRQCSFPSTSQHVRSASLPSTTQSSQPSTTQPPQPSYSNYLPAPPIDWTLTSTRQKAYEALERDRRGLRGLWRKIVPRICCQNQRAGFFDDEKGGRGSDGSSVRRYRVDLHNDDKEEIGANGSAGGESSASRPALEGKRTMSGWGCWGIRRGGGPGAGERWDL